MEKIQSASGQVRCGDSSDRFVDIVLAVAEFRDVDPLELPPIGEVIDTDALEKVLDTEPDDTAFDVSVAFGYADCFVTVYSDGTIDVDSVS
ncbi:HalOD1 output domain-containing protein [Haloarchaeobius sp. DYHT-AS-18]|uniref:HalOD1 output domain-containing protein n=1 Tax=Haloarchaeobius sp. DYHT-AS-18 TaxID=3446117 RepID=UPI003EB919CB